MKSKYTKNQAISPNQPNKNKIQEHKSANSHSRKPSSAGTSALLRNLLVLGIVLVTYFSFSPSLRNGFTNWDDPTYLTENEMIRDVSKNFKQIMTKDVSANYHPLTMLSLALEYKWAKVESYLYTASDVNLTPAELSKKNEASRLFHRTNVILHVCNTLFVFFFIWLLSDKRLWVASMVALLFGVHPMHVESVSWISERKDVLHTFFYMAALIVYMYYLKVEKKKGLYYLASLLLFVLSLFSKATAVTLPMVMLLCDYYTGRKFSKGLVLEKLPFFGLSILFGVLSVKAQAGISIAAMETFTIFQRIMFASYGALMYLIKFILPINLSAFYPYPNLIGKSLSAEFYVAPFLILMILGIVFYSMKKTKVIAFGMLFFFVTIALVLQFISVGSAIMADRYSYIPYIGLLFMVGMGVDQMKNKSMKNLSFVALFFVAIIFSVQTYGRAQVWKNNDTLWSDVIRKYPQADVSYKNRGNYYAQMNEFEKALADFNNYIVLNQTDAKIYSNRGNIFGLQRKFKEALDDYSKSIQLDVNNHEGYFNRAVTYSMMKEYEKALVDYNKTLELMPNMEFKVYLNRGYALINMGRYDDAIADYTKLLSVEPNNADSHYYLAFCYFNKKNYEQSIFENTQAIALKDNYAAAYFNRGVSYNSSGKFKNAYEDIMKSKSLGQQVDDAFLEGIRKNL